MSMNLKASTKDGTIMLWQTSTQISYTILPPAIANEVKGKKARNALLRYIEYVKHSINGEWETIEQLEDAKRNVNDHVAYIAQFLDCKTLRVWVM